MEQLNFKDEGLKVDWIGLNCEKLEESNLKKVVEFLSEFGFNVTLKEKKDQEWETRKLVTYPYSNHTVEIQQHYYQPEKKSFGLVPKSILRLKTRIIFIYKIIYKKPVFGICCHLSQTLILQD